LLLSFCNWAVSDEALLLNTSLAVSIAVMNSAKEERDLLIDSHTIKKPSYETSSKKGCT
jgi:hypothetical protein